MGGLKVPIYITPREVADILGWTKEDPKAGQERALRWLQSAGAAMKRGGRWVTTRDLLRNAFPEVYEEIQIAKFERDE